LQVKIAAVQKLNNLCAQFVQFDKKFIASQKALQGK